MKKTLAIGTLIVFSALTMAATALAGDYHTSTGVVSPSSDSKILVVTRVDLPSVPDHRFVITDKTQIMGTDGQRLALTDLRAGDYIREECQVKPDGTFEARKIVLLTPFHESWFR